MADDDQDVQTVPMAEHKALQRKLTKAQSRAVDAIKRAESLEAGQSRMQDTLTGMMEIITEGDADAGAKVKALINTTEARKSADTSAATLTARLDGIVEDSDNVWEDSKFDAARAVVEEIEKSGDLSHGYEAERLIKDAIESTSTDDDSFEDRVEKAAAEAVLKDRQELGRVDTKDSASTSTRVTYADVGNLNPKAGKKANKESMDAALDQYFTR